MCLLYSKRTRGLVIHNLLSVFLLAPVASSGGFSLSGLKFSQGNSLVNSVSAVLSETGLCEAESFFARPGEGRLFLCSFDEWK